MPTDALTWIAAALVAVLSIGRITRLLTEDSWPPVVWLRMQWVERARDGWEELAICPFCMAPWVSLVVLFTGWATDLHPLWWWINGWFAVAYVAAMVVARDIPGGE